ncbi:MAG: hypothetical protein IPP40_18160 [bacterium]|nr:hypothetical protein [bacterium]
MVQPLDQKIRITGKSNGRKISMDMFDLMKVPPTVLGKTDGQVNLGGLAGSVMGMMSERIWRHQRIGGTISN